MASMQADYLYSKESVECGIVSIFPEEFESFKETNVSLNNLNENLILQNYYEDFINLDSIEWPDLKSSWMEEDIINKNHEEHTYCTLPRNFHLEEDTDCDFIKPGNRVYESCTFNETFNGAENDFMVSDMESGVIANNHDCINNAGDVNQFNLPIENDVEFKNNDNMIKDAKDIKELFNYINKNCLVSDDDDFINGVFDFDLLNLLFNYEDDSKSCGYVDLDVLYDQNSKKTFIANNADDEEIDIIHNDEGDVCSESSNGQISGNEECTQLSKYQIVRNKITNYSKGNRINDKFKTHYLDDNDYYDEADNDNGNDDDDEFEPYLKNPVNKKRCIVKFKKNSFGKLKRNYKDYGMGDKESRKREQNKEAATRYRQKKKKEEIELENLRRLLSLRNRSLKKSIAKKEVQIEMLKSLILN